MSYMFSSHASCLVNFMSVIKSAWNLGKGIFLDKNQRKSASLFLILSVIFELGLVYCQYLLSYWSNDFYTALQNFDETALYKVLIEFCVLVSSFITLVVLQYTFQSKLLIFWRNWMVDSYINKWLMYNAYYGINLMNNENDNPDQRISEDINSFINLTITLLFGLLNSIVTLLSFFSMLWTLSGSTKLAICVWEFNVDGYFLWIAVLYSLFGTLVTYLIGKKLSILDYLQEKREANFRFAMMRMHENSESIALYGGNNYEKSILKLLFNEIINNFYAIIQVTTKLKAWQSMYINISNIIPIAAALPKFFAKEIQLGGLMQIRMAFGQIESALSFLISSFTTIASYKAVTNRLLEFNQHVEIWDRKITNKSIKFLYQDSGNIILSNVDVYLPNGASLIKNFSFDFKSGNSYLITGKSGTGKSTLVKLIKGLWPFASGEVILPKDAKVFFIPQKIYMPFGMLKDVIWYPNKNIGIIEIERVKSLLMKFDLSYLIERLEKEELWTGNLSIGEQQKISILRAIIAKSNVLIMDESTSALAESDEDLAFDIIKKELPDITIISVGHRGGLRKHHTHEIRIG